jgi:hypothetical protein
VREEGTEKIHSDLRDGDPDRIGALKTLNEAKEQVDGIPITFLRVDTEASVSDYLLEQEATNERPESLQRNKL